MARERTLTRSEADLRSLGTYIRERRKALGMTQSQLAERLGWTQERISTMENAKYGVPAVPALGRLASALDVSLLDVLRAVGIDDKYLSTSNRADSESDQDTMALLYALERLLSIDALSLKDALGQVADMVAGVMGADKVDAMMYDPTSDSLVALGSSNTPMGRREVQIGMDRIPIANGGREVEVYLTGVPYQTGWAKDDPGMLSGFTEGLGVQALLAVPFEVGGKRQGVLVAESSRPDSFAPGDLQFLQVVAHWAGMVGQRAELRERVTTQTAASTRRAAAEELMTVLAHDLGNHLTPLKGQIDLLRRQATRDERGEYVRMADEAGRAVGRIEHLIGDLLDTARLERGILALATRPVDLVALIDDVAAEHRNSGSRIDLWLPEECTVQADPSRLCQALENLLTNAVRHTTPGTTVLVTLRRETRDDGEWALIDVQDRGPGIPADVLPTLFQRFSRGMDSGGLGLGLYLARGVAEAHGGTLTVESEIGRGSTFRLSLPVSPQTPEGANCQ